VLLLVNTNSSHICSCYTRQGCSAAAAVAVLDVTVEPTTKRVTAMSATKQITLVRCKLPLLHEPTRALQYLALLDGFGSSSPHTKPRIS
jgi:hypothetical protein